MGKMIFIEYDENRTGGHALSDEPYSDREPEVITTRFKYASTRELKGSSNWSKEVSDEVYDNANHLVMVVVKYTDGDTFGHTSGYWDVITVFDAADKNVSAKIEEIKWAVENTSYDHFRDKNYNEEAGLKTLKKYGYDAYIPWNGYFNRLDDIETIFIPLLH